MGAPAAGHVTVAGGDSHAPVVQIRRSSRTPPAQPSMSRYQLLYNIRSCIILLKEVFMERILIFGLIVLLTSGIAFLDRRNNTQSLDTIDNIDLNR